MSEITDEQIKEFVRGVTRWMARSKPDMDYDSIMLGGQTAYIATHYVYAEILRTGELPDMEAFIEQCKKATRSFTERN